MTVPPTIRTPIIPKIIQYCMFILNPVYRSGSSTKVLLRKTTNVNCALWRPQMEAESREEEKKEKGGRRRGRGGEEEGENGT